MFIRNVQNNGNSNRCQALHCTFSILSLSPICRRQISGQFNIYLNLFLSIDYYRNGNNTISSFDWSFNQVHSAVTEINLGSKMYIQNCKQDLLDKELNFHFIFVRSFDLVANMEWNNVISNHILCMEFRIACPLKKQTLFGVLFAWHWVVLFCFPNRNSLVCKWSGMRDFIDYYLVFFFLRASVHSIRLSSWRILPESREQKRGEEKYIAAKDNKDFLGTHPFPWN